jgi:hypothetical protein
MAWTNLGTVAPGDVLRASSGTAAYNNVIGNLSDLRSYQNRYAQAKRTSGNITLNSTGWANVDTGLDLTLNAASGDVVEVAISANIQNQAVEAYFDVVTVVAGSPVNSFGRDNSPANPPTSYGIMGWLCGPSVAARLTGGFFRTLAAGDISAGTVTLRLRYATQTATNRTLDAGTANALHWWARNHGPVTT